MRTALCLQDDALLLCPLHGKNAVSLHGRGTEGQGNWKLHKASFNSIHKEEPLWSTHLLKDPSFNTTKLAIKFQHLNFGGDTLK
jgi:hypothetical protein